MTPDAELICPKPLTLGSLFAGIGGFELGLERTGGFKTEWQVEIDPYCQRVLAKHWPDVRRWDDVRTFPPPGEWGVDVICGGFPCQDISLAGKGIGSDGNRSGLWREYIRIVREIRPRFVIVENVANLLFDGLSRILGELSTCGYDAEWEAIPAAAVGAPHYRDRVFLFANARGQHGRFVPKSVHKRSYLRFPNDDRTTQEWSNNRNLSVLVPGIHSGTSENWWRAQSRMDRSVNGIPDRLERVGSLGNAVVPQCAEWIGRRLLEAISQ